MTVPGTRPARRDVVLRAYACKFDLDWNMDCHQPCDGKPTDGNLAKVLGSCARPPRPQDYPAIRRYVLVNRAVQQSAAGALAHTEWHNDAAYRWVLTGPRGSAEFTISREGGNVAVCYHGAGPDGTDACELLPAGTCWFERDLAGGQRVLAAWQQNDSSLWAVLEGLYAERFTS